MMGDLFINLKSFTKISFVSEKNAEGRGISIQVDDADSHYNNLIPLYHEKNIVCFIAPGVLQRSLLPPEGCWHSTRH
jgi:hypothetical protein